MISRIIMLYSLRGLLEALMARSGSPCVVGKKNCNFRLRGNLQSDSTRLMGTVTVLDMHFAVVKLEV